MSAPPKVCLERVLAWLTYFVRISLAVVSAGAAWLVPAAQAQSCAINIPHIQGVWKTLPYLMPINPISMTLLHTGQVLLVAGSEADTDNNSYGAESYRNAVWDPQGTTEASVMVQSITYDVFCSGTAVLPDGRPLVVGGTSNYSFAGDNRGSFFDPATSKFAQSQNMADGRWYGTATTLGDGRVMAFSGLNSSGTTNNTVELYSLTNAGAGWTAPVSAPFGPPLFPRMFLLPDGQVFFNGQGSSTGISNSWIYRPSTGVWTQSAATTGDREYGSAVLLPLLPPAYTPKVMNFGGGYPVTSSTEIIDLSLPSPVWVPGPAMSTGRIEMNTVILPNGKVLALDGSVNNEQPDNPGKQADLYDPVANSFASAGTAAFSRLYHSTSVLLPDATVVSMGSNPGSNGNYEPSIEIYTPPYLFDANDRPITNRPVITGTSNSVLGYNAPFSVTYTSNSAISSAVLLRPGSSTHSFNMEQRLIGLCGASPQPACSGSGTLNLTTPPDGNIAPPGYYMLFLIDGSGVPSVAKFIQISPYATAPPHGVISSPASDVTVRAGSSVSFRTQSTAAQYSWIFPGGSPATSTAQAPNAVTFATPGTYTVSLTVIDANGDSDPSPPTRTITVLPPSQDFTVSVSPSAQTVIPGHSTAFTVTVTAVSGFNGTVGLSVSNGIGFPAGITSGGFSPSSISGRATSTLTINTTTGATPYAFSLTITANAGSLVHTASTTLLVNLSPPASLTASSGAGQIALSWPASVGATSYHVKRSLVSGGPYIGVACTSTTSFTDTAVVSGMTYYYVVSAVDQTGPDGGGESSDSSEASAIPAPPPPSPPTCQIASVLPGPPAQLSLTMQDTNSGLMSISVSNSINVTTTIPPYTPGTKSPVTVTAAQTNTSQRSTALFAVTNVAGGAATCGTSFGGPPSWTSLGGTPASKIAVIADANGRLQAFIRGTDNALWTMSQTSPDGPWSGWQSLGGSVQGAPSVAINADGRLEVFVLGTDAALWHIAQSTPGGTWSGWASLFGSFISNPAVAASSADGRLEVFVVGTDTGLWRIAQTSPGGSWSFWTSSGGAVVGDPSAVSEADGRLDVFVTGTNKVLYYIEQAAVGGSWKPWASLGGQLAGNPVSVANQDGRLQVFVVGTDAVLYDIAQTTAGGAWSGWNSLGGASTSDPAVAVDADGRLEVFVRGTDNMLWGIAQTAPNSAWANWMTLGGVLANGPVAALDKDGRLDVFVEGTDGGFWFIEQPVPGVWN